MVRNNPLPYRSLTSPSTKNKDNNMSFSLSILLMFGIVITSIGAYLFHMSRATSGRYFWSISMNAFTMYVGGGLVLFGLISICRFFSSLSSGSWDFLNKMGPLNILLGGRWDPPKADVPGIESLLGFLPLDVTTLMVAAISGVVSIFIGRAIGIAAAQITRGKFWMLLFLYVFLMIPSVTWAFMGAIYLQPLLGWAFALQDDRTVLSTALTIAGLNIPVVAILTNAAIGSIPQVVWDQARYNQADSATRWRWYLKPQIEWQLWIISLVVVLRGAAETTIASRLMGGVQDLSNNPFWEWPLLGGNTLSKVASEYLRPESPDHPMNAPGGADFALAKIFIDMLFVVAVLLLIRYMKGKRNVTNTILQDIKRISSLEVKLFKRWILGSCITGICVLTFVFGALIHMGGHMLTVTEIRYQGVCPSDGEFGKKELRGFLVERLGIENPTRQEKRELPKIYGKSPLKGTSCIPGEQIDTWLLPSTQTDGYVKGLDPLTSFFFETRSFGPKSKQLKWIDELLGQGLSWESLNNKNDSTNQLIRVTWNWTLFSSTKFDNDPFKNGFQASFWSSLLNSLVAVFAVIGAFLGAVFIRFSMWKTLQMPVSMTLALSLSIPALGYGYMGRINFVDTLGLPNAVNITLYMTTWMVVFMVAIVNFTSRLQEVPESALDTGRSHAFRRLESIVTYVISKDFQGLCLIGALAMTAGLQETSQWFPVGGLNIPLGEPSLWLLGEARPLNAVAYSLRAMSDPAFEAIEACLHIALLLTILPFAVLAAILERKK